MVFVVNTHTYRADSAHAERMAKAREIRSRVLFLNKC
jgi:hypothetical protein